MQRRLRHLTSCVWCSVCPTGPWELPICIAAGAYGFSWWDTVAERGKAKFERMDKQRKEENASYMETPVPSGVATR